MEHIVIDRRITVFLKETIAGDEATRRKLADKFPCACIAPDSPHIAPQPILAAVPLQANQPWRMLESMTAKWPILHFSPQRIDIASEERCSDDTQTVQRMMQRLAEVMEALQISSLTRMAYNPLVATDDSDSFHAEEFLSRKTSLPKIENAAPSNKNLQMSYRIERTVGKVLQPLNVACSMAVGNKTDIKGSLLSLCLLTSLDINTLPMSERKSEERKLYTPDDLEAFVSDAVEWSKSIIDTLIA